jgi:hypothetical protein
MVVSTISQSYRGSLVNLGRVKELKPAGRSTFTLIMDAVPADRIEVSARQAEPFAPSFPVSRRTFNPKSSRSSSARPPPPEAIPSPQIYFYVITHKAVRRFIMVCKPHFWTSLLQLQDSEMCIRRVGIERNLTAGRRGCRCVILRI